MIEGAWTLARLLECGTDCWGPEGCKTEEGRCIRFSCRLDTDGEDFCDACMGWNEITYDQWLGGGYCEDVTAKFRMDEDEPDDCTDWNDPIPAPGERY